jgi:hypothetical protein
MIYVLSIELGCSMSEPCSRSKTIAAISHCLFVLLYAAKSCVVVARKPGIEKSFSSSSAESLSFHGNARCGVPWVTLRNESSRFNYRAPRCTPLAQLPDSSIDGNWNSAKLCTCNSSRDPAAAPPALAAARSARRLRDRVGPVAPRRVSDGPGLLGYWCERRNRRRRGKRACQARSKSHSNCTES